MLSRTSGSDRTCIIKAESATLRVIGPAARPGVGRINRDPAQARLEAENTTPAGRQTQRTTDVGADVQRAQEAGKIKDFQLEEVSGVQSRLSKSLDMRSMQARYSFVKKFQFHRNLLTNRGLSNVDEAIKHWLKRLPHVGEILPKQWILIREEL